MRNGRPSPLDEPSGTQLDLERYAACHPQFGVTSGITDLLRAGLELARDLGGPVLDLGCGEGGTLEAIARSAPNPDGAFGLELSVTRGKLARSRGFGVVSADSLAAPVRPGSVALAVSRHVIEHVASDQRAIAEIVQLLKPGGALYLETPLRLPGAWYPYRNADGRRVLDPTHVREYNSTDELLGLIVGAGLRPRPVEVVPIRFPVGHLLLRVPGAEVAPPRVTRYLRDLPRPAIGIPRYREMRCLATKA